MRRGVALLALGAALAGCGGAREVRTQPPRPATAPAATAPSADRTALTVTFAVGAGLPADVSALRLRVAAVWLKPAGSPWEKRPTGAGPASSDGRPVRLLAADVPAVRYDSLALLLAEASVAFGPNAGGPLSTPDSLVRLPLPLDLAGVAADTLRLHLDPTASLTRDTTECRWRFTPAVRVR